MKKFFFYLLTIGLVLWTQLLLNRVIGGSWMFVNLVLVIVLYFGLARGPLAGQLAGFTWGLLVDASALGLLGMHALLFALAGYLAGMMRRQLDASKGTTQAVLSFALSGVYLVIYLGLDRLFAVSGRPVTWWVAAQPVFNAAVAPLCFWAMGRWAEAWGMDPLES